MSTSTSPLARLEYRGLAADRAVMNPDFVLTRFYETDTGKLYFWNGAAWIELSTGGGGGITGSGSAGQVTYWTAATVVAGDAGFTYDAIKNEVGIDNIQWDLTPTPLTAVEGLMYWNVDDGTLNLGLPGGKVNYQLGQELFVPRRVKNNTVTNFKNGQIVYITGGDGTNAYIDLAKADAEATSASTIAMLTEDIDATKKGYATMFGLVRGDALQPIDTSAYAPGTILYLSPTTAGGFTGTKPSAPNHLVTIGQVFRQHATDGMILVKIDNGYELSELHDVAISGLASGDILRYNGTLWVNATLATAGIVNGTGAAGQVTYWMGTNTISGDALFKFDAVNKRVGVNIAVPLYTLHVDGGTIAGTVNSNTVYEQFYFKNSSAGSSAFSLNSIYNDSGTAASRLAIGVAGTNYSDTAYRNFGLVQGDGGLDGIMIRAAKSGNTGKIKFQGGNIEWGIITSGKWGFGEWHSISATPQALMHGLLADTATTTASTEFILAHNSSNTPAAGFGTRQLWQLKSSTTADQNAAALDITWSNATHATRTGRVALTLLDVSTERTAWQADIVTGFGTYFTIGGQRIAVATKTADYTLIPSDRVVVANKATAIKLTLPAATGTGQIFSLASIGLGACTIQANGAETINGSNTQVLYQWEAVTIADYGAGTWIVI